MTHRITALILASTVLLGSCSSKTPQEQSSNSVEPTPVEPVPVINTAVKDAAIAALQNVDSVITVGTNMTGYASAIVPANTAVQQYLAQDSTSDTAIALRRTLTGHRAALDWWRCNLEEVGTSSDWVDAAKCRDAVLPVIAGTYPDLGSDIAEAIATREAEDGKPLEVKSFALDKEGILKRIWQETSADTSALSS